MSTNQCISQHFSGRGDGTGRLLPVGAHLQRQTDKLHPLYVQLSQSARSCSSDAKFAVQFPPDTVEVVRRVLTDCSSRLRITHGLDCPWEGQQQLGNESGPDATPPVSLSLKSRHLRSPP
jgi:hypothetical protein